MQMFEKNFLGKGWSFPPQFDDSGSNIKMITNEEDIENSLHVLLSTGIGERIMQPDFGCNLEEMLFEPLTTSLQTKIKDLVFTAIYNFETRIKPLEVLLTAKDLDGYIEIEVQYEVKATNSRYNIVFPYYLIEGKSNI